ncbi:hypothetical protein Tco_0589645, partial [Tanacetum coccineum]
PLSPAAARTMPQRMARLEEDVHEIRGALCEQREVIGAMARDFSRLTVWAASGIAQLFERPFSSRSNCRGVLIDIFDWLPFKIS